MGEGSGAIDGEGTRDLSVVVPAYNERGCIAASLAAMSAYLDSLALDYEIIVVCDGSQDGTEQIVAELACQHCRLRLISYPCNRGKGFAVRTGITAARGRFVMFFDADLTVPITIVPQFLAALRDGYDIAIASRRHPASSALALLPRRRQVMGQVFSWFVRRLVIDDLGDTQCGGKAYRAEVARCLFGRQRIDHFSFDAEVLYLARRLNCRIKEVPFVIQHAPSGSSIQPVRDSLVMLRDLLRIRLYALRGRYE